jgi:hypothetical protein
MKKIKLLAICIGLSTMVNAQNQGIYDGDGALKVNTHVRQNDNYLHFQTNQNDGFSVDSMTFSVDGKNHRVGIGTSYPSATLDLQGTFRYSGGNAGANKVLTSDTQGNATWQTPSGGKDGNGIYGGGGSLISSYTQVNIVNNRLNFSTYFNNGFSIGYSIFSVDGSKYRVGIGTNSPAATLDVIKTGRFFPPGAVGKWAAIVENPVNSAGENGLFVANREGTKESTVFEAGSYWNGKNKVYTPILTVLGNRSVGIGTNNPIAPLEVHGNSSVHPVAKIQNNNSKGYSALNFNNDQGVLVAGTGYGNSNASINPNIAYSFTKTNINYKFIIGERDRMFISGTTGHVGIGTINPIEPLDLLGYSSGAVMKIRNGDPKGFSATSVFSYDNIYKASFGYGNPESPSSLGVQNIAYIYTPSGGDFKMRIGNTDALFIEGDNGNIGIGTTTPTEKLNVNGTILTNAVHIAGSPNTVNTGSQGSYILWNKNCNSVSGDGPCDGATYFLNQRGNGTGGFYFQENYTSAVDSTNIDSTIMHISPHGDLKILGYNASKATPGEWVANSDKRLKKEITSLASEEILQKMMQLQGVSYYWNDNKTGCKRPSGIQYGFTAQNIQNVFPELVTEDDLGYLQTAYGTYDAMTIEAIRALLNKIEVLDVKFHKVVPITTCLSYFQI